MIVRHEGFEIDDDRSRIDFAKVHSWLTEAYWSNGVSQEKVERAAQFSTVVLGAYAEGAQVGYCRVVSDRTTFAWLSDVYVDPAFRGKGVAQALTDFALKHPDLANMKRWLLATKDAQPLYSKLGFEPLANPEHWMLKGKQAVD